MKTQAQGQYGRLTNKQRAQIGKSVRFYHNDGVAVTQVTYLPLAHEILFRTPHALVHGIASDAGITQVSCCHAVSLCTFL